MATDSLRVLNIWCSIFNLILTVILFIYHLFKLLQNNGFRKKIRLFSILSLLLIFQALIGITFFIVTETITETTSNRWFCVFTAHYQPTNYLIFKFILYSILTIRFAITFKDSSIRYSVHKLKIWIIFLFIWTLGNIIVHNITAENIKGQCEVAVPPIQFMVSLAFLDIVACVVNTILFSRPLLQFHKQRQKHGHNKSKKKGVNFKSVAIKQCILSIIAVLSTLISLMLIGMFNIYVITISIDYVVSIVCIILMYAWNKGIIGKICFCFVSNTTATHIMEETRSNSTVKTADIEATAETNTTKSVEIVENDKPSLVVKLSNRLSNKRKTKNEEIHKTLIDEMKHVNVSGNGFEEINKQQLGLERQNSMPTVVASTKVNNQLKLKNAYSQPVTKTVT